MAAGTPRFQRLSVTYRWWRRFLPWVVACTTGRYWRLRPRRPGRWPWPEGKSTTVLVVSSARSGSTFMCTTLNAMGYPFIYYGELFAFLGNIAGVCVLRQGWPRFGWAYLRGRRRSMRRWQPHGLERAGIDPRAVFAKMARTEGLHLVKVFPEHLEDDALADIIREQRPLVVLLRRDAQERYVSLQRALRTGHWHGGSYGEVEVELDEHEIAEMRAEQDALFALVERSCAEAGIEPIELAYAEIADRLRDLARQVSGGAIDYGDDEELPVRMRKQA